MATIKSVSEQALGLLGISDTITTLADGTARTKALLRYYDSTVEYCLRLQPWRFATRYFDLTEQDGDGTVTVASTVGTFTVDQDGTLDTGDTIVIADVEYTVGARTSGTVWALTGADVAASAFTITKEVTADPTPDWGYAYRVPSKVLVSRRLVDGNRTPIRSNRPVYRMGADADGPLLYTDYDVDVLLEYTESVDEAEWPSDFAMGVAGMLAYYVAPLLAEGDRAAMDRAGQIGMQWLMTAAANDAQQDVPDDDPMSDLEQFRNGGDGWVPTRLIRN